MLAIASLRCYTATRRFQTKADSASLRSTKVCVFSRASIIAAVPEEVTAEMKR
jgi:hypothetical protein